MRDYYGRHYDGQFKPLAAAIWTKRPDEEDAILRADRLAREELAERDRTCSLMERFTRRVYKAIETEYVGHPDRRESLRSHLVYWAKRLRHFQGRDWEDTCFENLR